MHNEKSNSGLLDFHFQENSRSLFLKSIKFRLFQLLTKNSLGLFIKGNDTISMQPQILGVHELHVTNLINYLVKLGYNDFLIDVGANIGLTSCQNGNSFKQVHMFEPNPYCCKILEVNSVISLNNTNYRIHPFGLGTDNIKSMLTVPRHNWGGAFINDKTNSYDKKTLAAKDGFEDLTSSNYFEIEIEIKNGKAVFDSLFQSLTTDGLKKGVIKIDVEGYEPTVLEGIAQSIPENTKAFIIFESWNKNLEIEKILSFFNGRATAYKLVGSASWRNKSKLKKLLSLFSNHKQITKVEQDNKNPDWSGDVIIQIN